MIRVTVWNEYFHDQHKEEVKEIYPDGIHGTIAAFLREEEDMVVRTATLEEPEHGLTEEVLENTDVLIWWGHARHWDVSDEVVARVRRNILSGMGAIFLHSSHVSKPFTSILGTSGALRWRESGDLERLWVVSPTSPIVQGIGDYIEIPHEETYGEHFDIPEPDKLIFIGWYEGGEVFRSGCCWNRGGRIFYFQPGHEFYPVYHQKEIQQVIKNAVRWAAPCTRLPAPKSRYADPANKKAE